MPQKVRIALDAMGGDHGPAVVVPGADLALAQHPDSTFTLFGDRATIEPLLAAHPRLRDASRLVHTEVAVRMDDKPSQALRNGRWKSSMWLAIDAVKRGEADVVISAGNTGALMAMAKFNLKTLPGESVVLDLGASIGADADSLVDMAVMGSAMARVLLHLDRPKVGLLNIGVEEVKGLEPVREAGRILREEPPPHIDYIGFVEGDDIGKGTARQFAEYLRGAISQHLLSKIGYLLSWQAFRKLRNKMDPRKSNGGVFLGLNGVVIKSHGGTDAEGFASAIDMGYDMVRYELLAKIGATIRRHAGTAAAGR